MGDGLVECYSGAAYAERPVALYWQGQRLEVDRVEAEWRIPRGKQFRVRTRDGRVFELEYDEHADSWQVHPA